MFGLTQLSAWEGHCDDAEPEAGGVMEWDAPVTTVMCPQS